MEAIVIGDLKNLNKLSVDELVALAVQHRLNGKTPEYLLQYLIGYTIGREIQENAEATAIRTPKKIYKRTRKTRVCP